MKLRDRIIETSIELFNLEGAHKISTNHIIDALGISPGTLYYHFRNREEIIREIFEKIITDFNGIYPSGDVLTVQESLKILETVYSLFYKYRFFYRDISILLSRDPLLRERYIENRIQRFRQQEFLFDMMIRSGIMRRPDSLIEQENLMDNLWMVTDFWFSYVQSSRDSITEKDIAGGIEHYFYMLKPYLEPSVVREFEQNIGQETA